MTAKDFALLCAACLAMGLNIVVSRWAIADMHAPPLAFAALRFLIVVAVLVPWLRRLPQQWGRLFLVSMGIGALHFALLFRGLQDAESGAAAITQQLGVPFGALMAMIFLGDPLGWRRMIGMGVSIVGVVIIAVDPAKLSASVGLVFVALSVFGYASANVLMKSMKPLGVFEMQAWVALMSCGPLCVMSFILEPKSAEVIFAGGLALWGAGVFAALAVSVFGHGVFYYLLKRYDMSLISPLTLMTPVWGVLGGVMLLGEVITLNMIFGGLLALVGVGVVMMGPKQAVPAPTNGGDRVGDHQIPESKLRRA